jgi:hypothetical protein
MLYFHLMEEEEEEEEKEKRDREREREIAMGEEGFFQAGPALLAVSCSC